MLSNSLVGPGLFELWPLEDDWSDPEEEAEGWEFWALFAAAPVCEEDVAEAPPTLSAVLLLLFSAKAVCGMIGF